MIEVQKLLDQEKGLFESIRALAIKNNGDPDGRRIIEKWFNNPQPSDWIESEESEFFPKEKYQFNHIALIEGLMNAIFDEWTVTSMSNTVIQDKGKFANLCEVQINCKLEGLEWNIVGSACEYAPDIKWMKLIVPLSLSRAKKNAIKNLGRLFGRDLNRITEELPSKPKLYQESLDEFVSDLEYDALKTRIELAPGYVEAKQILESDLNYRNNVTLGNIVLNKLQKK